MLCLVLTLPPLRFGLRVTGLMAVDHQSSNPTRERGGIGVELHYIRLCRWYLSLDRVDR
jgi:hypothetical protein